MLHHQPMKHFVHYFLAIVALQGPCRAEVTKLPAGDQKVLRDSSRFHDVGGTTNLPSTVFALCADDSGRLAEPGKK